MKSTIIGTCLCVLLVNQAVADSIYDCWVGNASGKYTTQFIRCIADRSSLGGGGQVSEGGYEAILDLIHRQLHGGKVEEAESTLRANADRLRAGDYASVLLYSYPTEWSWKDALPQRLVQSALCREGNCTAIVFRK